MGPFRTILTTMPIWFIAFYALCLLIQIAIPIWVSLTEPSEEEAQRLKQRRLFKLMTAGSPKCVPIDSKSQKGSNMDVRCPIEVRPTHGAES